MTRLLLALLLLASPLSSQVTITGMTLEDVTITATAASVPAENWADNMVAVYDFEASGDPWKNDIDSSGGSGCDMTVGAGTPTRETGAGSYYEGTAGLLAEDAGAEGEYMNSGCNDLNEDFTDVPVSWGGWLKTPNDSSGEFLGYSTSSTGFQLRRGANGDKATCRAGGSVSETIHDSSNDVFPVDTWVHVTCVYDHSGQEIADFINGDTGNSPSAHTGNLSSRDWRLGGAIQANDVYADEVFVYAGVLTEADTCRIASCGIDGSLCSCNGTAWVDDGRHTTLSLTCTLPTNCNEAAP